MGRRIFGVVLLGAKRLPETKAAKLVLKYPVVGFGQKCDSFRLCLTKMHSAEGANAFAQFERAAGVLRDLLIDVAEPLEIGWVGDENPGHNAGTSRVANRILTHRKWLEERRMRLLIGLGNDANPAYHPLLVDLAWRPVLAGPFGHWPALNALLVGIRNLVILAIVGDRVLGPGFADDVQHFFVDVAVVLVNRRAIHGCPGGMILLPQDVHPAVLIAA